MERCFYFTEKWQQARQMLPGSPNLQVSWWDAGEPDDLNDPEAVNPEALIDPSLDPSIRGRLDVLIERFACGHQRSGLIRPVGAGMEPPFKRMDNRRGLDLSAVVEMRTYDTRTFGFFVGKRVFIAHRLDLTDNLKNDPSLYEKYARDVLAFLDRMNASEKDTTSEIEDLIGD